MSRTCAKFTHTNILRRKIEEHTKESRKLCRCTSGLLELSFVMHLTTCLRNKHTTSKVVPKISGNPSDTTYTCGAPELPKTKTPL